MDMVLHHGETDLVNVSLGVGQLFKLDRRSFNLIDCSQDWGQDIVPIVICISQCEKVRVVPTLRCTVVYCQFKLFLGYLKCPMCTL